MVGIKVVKIDIEMLNPYILKLIFLRSSHCQKALNRVQKFSFFRIF